MHHTAKRCGSIRGGCGLGATTAGSRLLWFDGTIERDLIPSRPGGPDFICQPPRAGKLSCELLFEFPDSGVAGLERAKRCAKLSLSRLQGIQLGFDGSGVLA